MNESSVFTHLLFKDPLIGYKCQRGKADSRCCSGTSIVDGANAKQRHLRYCSFGNRHAYSLLRLVCCLTPQSQTTCES